MSRRRHSFVKTKLDFIIQWSLRHLQIGKDILDESLNFFFISVKKNNLHIKLCDQKIS